MSIVPINAPQRWRDDLEKFNSPALVNEYRNTRGVASGRLADGFAIDLLDIWRLARSPIKRHPFVWLNLIETQRMLRFFWEQFPEDVPLNNIDNVPILAFPHETKEDIDYYVESFKSDRYFDGGRWLDSSLGELFAHPWVAHRYASWLSRSLKHLWVPQYPVGHTLNYRGYSLRGTYKDNAIGRVALYDIANIIGGKDHRNYSEPEIVSEVRRIRRSSKGRRASVLDMDRYGAHLLRELWGADGYSLEFPNAIYAFVGLTSLLPEIKKEDKAMDDDVFQAALKQANITPEYIKDEVFPRMKPIREMVSMVSNERDSYILVTAEMAKLIIDELLRLGFLDVIEI